MLDITTLYEPYDFEDDTDGPGCGVEAHDADCLCDVRPVTSKPTVDTYPLLATAARALYERDSAPTLGNLLAELLGIFEASRPTQLTLSANEVAALVHEYHQAPPMRGGYQGHAAVVALIHGGLDLVTVANLMGVDPTTIGRLFVRSHDDAEGAVNVVKVAMMLHPQDRLFADVARDCDVSEQTVWNLANTFGYKSAIAARRAAGGGDKYEAAARNEAIRLRLEEGLTFAEIGRRLGMPKDSAKMIVYRHLAKNRAA